jgi:hypothetical protein
MVHIKSNKVYDFVKWLALVFIPALSVFYVALGAVWEFQNTAAVLGTLAAVDTLLGSLVHLSSASYKASDAAHDGVINVIQNDNGGQIAQLELHKDPEELINKTSVSFKVNPIAAELPLQSGAAEVVQDPGANPGGTNGY